MRNATTLISVLGLAVGLALFAACSTDSPTAPEQNPPPPGGGSNQTAYNIEIRADPQEINVNPAIPAGQQCSTGGGEGEETESSLATLRITVREQGTNRLPPDGTTVLLEATLGTFEPFSSVPVQATGAELHNGRAFVNFYACSTAGTAIIRATIGTSSREQRVIIRATPLVARWRTSNPEANNSVQFINDSDGQPDRVEWRFGDGQTSDEFNPHHVYNQPGSYMVTLTVYKKQRADECQTSIGTGTSQEFTCNEPPTDPPAP